ncbi:MAG TPA: thiamine phosphate synthase [Micropepsaceae bacterium]
MASVLARVKLARAARLLNAAAPHLPPLILMTDQTRLADPLAAARALPKGAAIILRHTEAAPRAALARALHKIARQRGLRLLIAGDAGLAARLPCDGLHLPEARAGEAVHWKALHPDWLITASAHSRRGLGVAARARCDAVLLAPVFATQSHIGREPFGVSRFCTLAGSARLPVYALGGVNATNVQRLAGTRLAGIAAIEALIPAHS